MRFKTYKRTTYRLPSPAALAGGGFALLVLVIGAMWLAEGPERVRTLLPQVLPATAPAAARQVMNLAPPGLVYRYSVIAGGVRGAAELSSKLAHDPVASVHYADFNVARATVVQVEKPRLVHVSYRIDDNIYWTKNKVRLAAGENLLTDGANQVRTRCGNRIADTPQGMVLENEPAPEVLDTLSVSADDLFDGSGSPATGAGALPGSAPNRAPAATRLQSVTSSSVRAVPDLVSRVTTLPAYLTAPVYMAPALLTHGGSDVPAVAGSGPSTPSTPATPATPATPSQPSMPETPARSKTPAYPSIPSVPSTPSIPSIPSPQREPAAQPPGTATPVPEPGSWTLVILALIALALVRRSAVSCK